MCTLPLLNKHIFYSLSFSHESKYTNLIILDTLFHVDLLVCQKHSQIQTVSAKVYDILYDIIYDIMYVHSVWT